MNTEPEPADDRESTQPRAPVPAAADERLQLLLDVPLSLSAELGGCRMTVGDVLQLTRGKVVELEKLAGDPLDIMLNGRLIARGEAVVVNEHFGVRIVDIASPHSRLTRLTG